MIINPDSLYIDHKEFLFIKKAQGSLVFILQSFHRIYIY